MSERFMVVQQSTVTVEADSPRKARALVKRAVLRDGSAGLVSTLAVDRDSAAVVAECEGCDAYATEADDTAAWSLDLDDGVWLCPACTQKAVQRG